MKGKGTFPTESPLTVKARERSRRNAKYYAQATQMLHACGINGKTARAAGINLRLDTIFKLRGVR